MMSSAEAPRPGSLVRLHGLNALFRGFSGNASFFYMNAVFVVQVGAKEFSNLFLLSTIVSVAFYLLFLFLTERQIHRAYLLMLMANIVFALAFPWIGGGRELIFAFALFCIATDLVSTNVAISAVQASINPALFNEVYQKVTNRELLARILATVLVTVSTRFEAPWLFFGSFYAAAIGQLICFTMLIRSMRLREEPIDPSKVLGATRGAFRYMFTNPFLRVTTILVVWAYSAKFLIEYLLYRKTTLHLDGVAEVGPFLSAINFSCTVLAFAMQKLFAKRMTASLPLSTLLSVLPILCLVGGILNLLDEALWPIVALSLGYYMVNRAIFLPSSRHCYVIVPTELRKNLTLTLPIFIAVFSILLGALVSALKETWSPLGFNLLLVVLTLPTLFVLNQFDGRYIRNLWDKFREIEIPENSGALPGLNLAQMPEPPKMEAVEAPARAPDVKGYIHKILAISEDQAALDRDQEHRMIGHCLKVYRGEGDQKTLREVVEWHRERLASNNERDRILALTLIEALGYRAFDGPLQRFIENPSSGDLASVARLVLAANRELRSLTMGDFPFAMEVRFRFLFGKYMRSESRRGLEGLRRLVRLRDPKLAQSFIEGLFAPEYKPLRSVLRSCLVKGEGQRLDMEPLVEKLLSLPFHEGEVYRRFLRGLRFDARAFRDVDRALAPFLVGLASEGFSIWDARSAEDQRWRFQNLLFLREWALPDTRHRHEIMASIGDLLSLEREQRLMLAQVHLEQLKSVPNHSIWTRFLRSA